MARLKFLTIVILLIVVKVHGRSIRLSSNQKLMSAAGVNHLELNSSFLSLKPHNSTKNTCIHYYSFLPCASNVPGYVFQIVVLEYLLLVGDRILTKGRQQLFSLFGVGIYGATLFRILQVLPNIVIVLASGLAKNKEAAKVTIENGVGTLAGSTVFYLTLQWGICVVLGRTKIHEESLPQLSKSSYLTKCLLVQRKLSSLKEYGVKTDKKTSYTAGIMLLSLIPFIMVELASIIKCQPWSHIATLTISCMALVSFFIFQSRHHWIQQRSLEYSKDQLLLAGFLDHLQKFAKRKLVNDEGKADASCIRRTFITIDKDKDEHISPSELRTFLENMKSENLGLDQEFAINELMKHFDQDENKKITQDEFLDGCQRFINNAKQIVVEKHDCSKQYLPWLHNMIQPWIHKREKRLLEIEKQLSDILKTAKNQQFAYLFTDGKPDEAKIRSLFEEFDADKNRKMSVEELKRMIMTKFKSAKLDHDVVVENMMRAFDTNEDDELHENEFLEGLKKRLSDDNDSQLIAQCIEKEKRSIEKMSLRALMKALLGVAVGVAIVSSLGLPLIYNTQLLSESIGIPPFFVSFVLLPFAVNFKTAMANIYPASQKKEGAASNMFSEIYTAVFMNNTLGLLTIVGLIWARGFTWEYSAEVLIIGVVSAIIGLIAYWHTTYPFWNCILAFSFYPLSLVLFYVIRYPLGWK